MAQRRNDMTALAQALGEGVAALQFSQLPPVAVSTAKTGFIDCSAVIVAGCEEAPVEILRNTLGAEGGVGEATLYFSSRRTTAPAAAWINGTAGHVLDYDDFARGHPSVVIVPALLAEGEVLDSSGMDLITAYVAGYEVFIDLLTRDIDSYQVKGWHPTPLIGALAAAAACARLRNLDAKGVTSALGLAAAQASGLTASYGTMAKSVQVGKAAHTGLLSARLAAQGMTAGIDVLDHAQGFLAALSPSGRVDLSRPVAIGHDWHILKRGLSIKRYPACYCVHRLVDGALELAARHPIRVADIAAIEVSLSKTHVTILKHHRPRTGMEAKFSAEFAVAAAFLSGNLGMREVNDTYVTRPEVQALMQRVSIVENENYDPESLGFSIFDQVKITLNDGSTLEGPQVRHALGHAKKPLSGDDLRRKFMDCLANARVDSDGLFADFLRLETLTSCRSLVRRSAISEAA